ncbi:MAG: archaemetzincin family Zn-dependent metalloprotease [Thermoplasmata archaeon]
MSKELTLVLFGDVPEADIRELGALLPGAGYRVIAVRNEPVPAAAYSPRRAQYLASAFLEVALRHPGTVLGITDPDLYTPDLNFVFGLAQRGGRGAVVSSHRLHHPIRRIYLERLVKEAIHELGHVRGLGHCPDPLCVMHFSNSLADTDRKGPWLCGRCSLADPGV